MKFPFSWFVGLRYTRAKRKNHFISFIALASMIGIALGVMVLITVMSVMNGFERELRERILGTMPHIQIGERATSLSDWRGVAEKIKTDPDVIGAAPFIDTNAMFKKNGVVRYGLLQGIDPDIESEVSILGEHMLYGELTSLKADEYGVLIGATMSRKLGVWMGDDVTVLVADGATVSPAGIAPRYRRFKVVGIFQVKSEIDDQVALIHIDNAAKLMRQKDGVSGIRLKIQQVLDAHIVSSRLRTLLGEDYWISDWNRTHGTLFRAIKMEKTMMFVLLTLIVAVAAFNIVSTMVMVVTDKQSDIAILRTLGVSPSGILKIFVVQGSINGIFGTLIGVICGVLLTLNLPDFVSWVESSFGVALVPGDVYFIGFLPTQLEAKDVLFITFCALLMSVIATIYPAWRASRVKPAEALRYE